MKSKKKLKLLIILASINFANAYGQNTENMLHQIESFMSSCSNVEKVQRAGSQFRVYTTLPAGYSEFDLNDFEMPNRLALAEDYLGPYYLNCSDHACVSQYLGAPDGQWVQIKPVDFFSLDCHANASHKLYALTYIYLHASQESAPTSDDSSG